MHCTTAASAEKYKLCAKRQKMSWVCQPPPTTFLLKSQIQCNLTVSTNKNVKVISMQDLFLSCTVNKNKWFA